MRMKDDIPNQQTNDTSPDSEQEIAAVAEYEAMPEDVGTIGDKLIDDVSLESNVATICKRTNFSRTVAKYIMGLTYVILGAVCIAIPQMIEEVLPYIIGSVLGVFAILRLIFAIIDKEYEHTNSNKTSSSLIMIGVSIMILIEHEWAHTFIPTVWGVWGLFEGAHAFNHAFSRIARHKRFFYYLTKGIVEVAVAFMLLYEPQQYGELHIIVFGISLVLDGLVALPFIHKFVTRR